jgi:hypothetical protein
MERISILYFAILMTCFTIKVNAQQWEALPYMTNFSQNVMYYDSTEDVSYIAGLFDHVNDTLCNIIKWDGSSHELLPSSPLYKTNCLIKYQGQLYAGGYGLARFDGTSWTYLDSNVAVICFYIHNDTLLIGGQFDSIAGITTGPVASWNGSAFSNVFRADTLFGLGTGHFVGSIVAYKEQLYLSGNFQGLSNPAIQEIVRFDGQHWTDVGAQINGDALSFINKMVVWRDTLYAAGQFNESAGSPGNSIAAWDDQHWHRLNNGLNPDFAGVNDMAVVGNNFYVAGTFYIMDGINLGQAYGKGLAKWDGSKWCSLGTNANGPMYNLGNWRDEMYVMGSFNVINDDSIKRIAHWIGGIYTDTCSDQSTSISTPFENHLDINVYPNPAFDRISICLKKTEKAIAQIYSTEGKCLRIVALSFADNTIYLNELPDGTYFLRIKNTREVVTKKIVKLSPGH